MPQENYPITITTPDTTYTITTAGEYEALPDSIQQLLNTPPNTTEPAVYEQEDYLKPPPPYEVSPEFIIGAIILMVVIIFKAKEALNQIEAEKAAADKAEQTARTIPHGLIYKGESLEFTSKEVQDVCSRYNPFYNKLNEQQQAVFIQRLGEFMYHKDYYIMSGNGYKEMPILISATAIQISFGLKEYLFPYFSRIIIHPEEYIAYDPLRILAGNVQGRSIALSWKHFLEDFADPADGKNVGLHEMAHALQVQHLFENYGYRNEFREDYEHYDTIDDNILLQERQNSTTLFDENALRNANEFWATSVELFFEKPVELQQRYPQLYSSISLVLNQDTAAM